MTRREAAKVIGASAASVCLPITTRGASESSTMLMRTVPSSGEKLPVIGLGTWRAFDVDLTSDIRRQLQGIRDKVFLATKVWTRGKESGIKSMERSMALLRTKRIDLMQVHNLLDVHSHLATLRQWKEQGRIRYLGITHYEAGAFADVEKIMRGEKLDFVQINYSLMEPEAEHRLLPLAQERAIAVIVNRPFGGGDIFERVRSKPLPDWAGEFDCRSWAQFFLKWIVAHPAVTCAIPATDKSRHLEDNMQGGIGRLPDANMRRRMTEIAASL